MKRATLEAARSSSWGGGWDPSGWASPWECRAAQSRRARLREAQEPSGALPRGPEEAQEPSGGAAMSLERHSAHSAHSEHSAHSAHSEHVEHFEHVDPAAAPKRCQSECESV